MRSFKNFMLAAGATAEGPAFAQECPPPLADALRLALVITPDMQSSTAQLQLFTRRSQAAPWRAAGAAEPAMVGTNGLAWGYTFAAYKRDDEPEKVEGDKRTPAGFFKLGPSFGFEPSSRAGHITVMPGETVCVEDAASAAYNTITQRSRLEPGLKADNMRDTALFRNGLFVAYPSDRATKRGSCIFVHIWSSPTTGTAGCVALPEPSVEALQAFAEHGAVLGVLPETARERFAGCLPQRVEASQ